LCWKRTGDVFLVRNSSKQPAMRISLIIEGTTRELVRAGAIITLMKIKHNNERLISCHEFSFRSSIGVLRVGRLNMNSGNLKDLI